MRERKHARAPQANRTTVPPTRGCTCSAELSTPPPCPHESHCPFVLDPSTVADCPTPTKPPDSENTRAVAREMRDLLMGILAEASLALESAEPASEVWQGLRRVQTTSRRMARLVRALVDVSRSFPHRPPNKSAGPRP